MLYVVVVLNHDRTKQKGGNSKRDKIQFVAFVKKVKAGPADFRARNGSSSSKK